MDEKALAESSKDKTAGPRVAVHDWPFPEEAVRAFYVKTEDGKRLSIRVGEFVRFQAGYMYF